MSSLLRDALEFAFVGESKNSRRLSHKSSGGSSRRSESFFSCAAESDVTSFKSCNSALDEDETFHNAENDIHETIQESSAQIPMGSSVEESTLSNNKNSITIVALANKKNNSKETKPKCSLPCSRMELLAIFLLTCAGLAAAVRIGMGSNKNEVEAQLQTNDDNQAKTLNNTNKSEEDEIYQDFNGTRFPSTAPTNITEASPVTSPCEDDDDDDKNTFLYHRKEHDCKWLQKSVRRNPDRYMKLCFPDGPAFDVCRKTCNNCWI